MELKLIIASAIIELRNLLIVPYGIETPSVWKSRRMGCLLIVPYGIETNISSDSIAWADSLLIVPYGIETTFSLRTNKS